jgi:hypothetical protein
MKDELKPIIEGLLTKSRLKQVAWRHASTMSTFSDVSIDPSDEDYAVSTSSYTLNLFRTLPSPDNQHKFGVRLNILNDAGHVVTGDTIYEGDPEYPAMNLLLDLAREAALGASNILKNIIENLKKPGVFGSTDTEPPPF